MLYHERKLKFELNGIDRLDFGIRKASGSDQLIT